MDLQDAVLGDRLLGWQEANVGRPAAATACLRVALVRQDPVQPRLEAVGVAKGWKIAPRTHERGLHRVLGQVGVAEDPRCDRHAAVAHLPREGVERFLVTTLRQVHELSLQRMPHSPIAMPGQQNDARGGVKGSISAARRPRELEPLRAQSLVPLGPRAPLGRPQAGCEGALPWRAEPGHDLASTVSQDDHWGARPRRRRTIQPRRRSSFTRSRSAITFGRVVWCTTRSPAQGRPSSRPKPLAGAVSRWRSIRATSRSTSSAGSGSGAGRRSRSMGERTYRRWNATNAAARISRRTNAPVTTTIEIMPMAQILALRRLWSVSSFNTIGSWWVGRYQALAPTGARRW